MPQLPGPVQKSLRLASLLPRHPDEFYDRVAGIAEFRGEVLLGKTLVNKSFEYQPSSGSDVLQAFNATVGLSIETFFADDGLKDIERHVRDRIDDMGSTGPFVVSHNADFTLARLAYALCRALHPGVVLETGVAYGVSSAFILKALETNGRGNLHSIDLPPLGKDSDRFVGHLIPELLKSRWILHRGVSRRVMPSLLRQLGEVGLFVHDAMHTYRNMSWELRGVTPYLAKPSAVIADDVDYNSAFRDWIEFAKPQFSATVIENRKSEQLERRNLFGVAVFA